jgi:membrane protein DedA with SNARE-associated domain
MMQSFVSALVSIVGTFGYLGIVILMALESSFFPFPSEVVMIPAGYLVQKGEMNMIVVILMGVFGSLIGAWLNYAIARTIGRKALITYGQIFFLSQERFYRMEVFLKKHGEIGTFIGRLIPGVRQYISFPAGLARMSLWRFTFWTGLGSSLWVAILTVIGYLVGENDSIVKTWTNTTMFWIIAGCLLTVLLYWKIRR